MANGTTTCDAKLVMLPDKQEEYAITMNTGLWGSAEANPTLQDGWNLTSLSGKADSKTAETLASFASFIKALPITPATAKLVNKPSAGRTVPACEGFYRLDYDQSGALRGFTYFHLPVRYVVRSAPTPTPSPPKADDKNCGKGGNPPCTK